GGSLAHRDRETLEEVHRVLVQRDEGAGVGDARRRASRGRRPVAGDEPHVPDALPLEVDVGSGVVRGAAAAREDLEEGRDVVGHDRGVELEPARASLVDALAPRESPPSAAAGAAAEAGSAAGRAAPAGAASTAGSGAGGEGASSSARAASAEAAAAAEAFLSSSA